jgi:hypothetical protein
MDLAPFCTEVVTYCFSNKTVGHIYTACKIQAGYITFVHIDLPEDTCSFVSKFVCSLWPVAEEIMSLLRRS